jgi:flagellar motor switch protein FliG
MVEGHMKTFVDDIGKDDLKAEHIKIYSSFFEDLIKLYPKAREEIIQKLADRYLFIEETETLKNIDPKDFTAAVIRRLGKSIP